MIGSQIKGTSGMATIPERPRDAAAVGSGRQWTFLSNHAHVLVCLASDPGARLRDVASQVGITERAVQKIVSDLESAGVLTRERDGRRNRYHMALDLPLRHPIERHRSIGALLGMLLGEDALSQFAEP